MPIVDPQRLWPKLDAMGIEQVRSKLASGAFGSWKRPLVEEWLRRAEQLPTPDTFMYHPVEAPSGRLFYASQVKSLESVGWLDSPAKFPASKPKKFRSAIKAWWVEWEWLVKAVGVLLGLTAAVVALLKVL